MPPSWSLTVWAETCTLVTCCCGAPPVLQFSKEQLVVLLLGCCTPAAPNHLCWCTALPLCISSTLLTLWWGDRTNLLAIFLDGPSCRTCPCRLTCGLWCCSMLQTKNQQERMRTEKWSMTTSRKNIFNERCLANLLFFWIAKVKEMYCHYCFLLGDNDFLAFGLTCYSEMIVFPL